MEPEDGRSTSPLSTVTHARLRALQGDLEGARRLLDGILAGDPGNPAAGELLERLAGMEPAAPKAEIAEKIEAPVAADPEDLRSGFIETLGRSGAGPDYRLARLNRYLARIRASRGTDDA